MLRRFQTAWRSQCLLSSAPASRSLHRQLLPRSPCVADIRAPPAACEQASCAQKPPENNTIYVYILFKLAKTQHSVVMPSSVQRRIWQKTVKTQIRQMPADLLLLAQLSAQKMSVQDYLLMLQDEVPSRMSYRIQVLCDDQNRTGKFILATFRETVLTEHRAVA